MFELHLQPCHKDEADTITEELEAYGALSVTLVDKEDEPILEPAPGETPLWKYSIAEALFASAIEAKAATDALLLAYPNLSHQLKPVPKQDWERACLLHVKPQQFGKKLWVCPTWETPPEPDATNLLLDPGLAFGTGTHPTTALCLRWLDGAELHNKTLIDYGCGSGILALAALRLGAAHVDAVDLDDQALIATKSNAEKNQIPSTSITCRKPEALNTPVDILLANILLTPLLSLKTRFQALLKPGGTLVLSGVLATQVETLLATYTAPDWIHKATQIEEEWACLIFENRAKNKKS